MAIKKSIHAFGLGQKVLVAGVNSPVRAFKSVGGHALVMDRGRKQTLIDVDSNVYTDYCLSWGALILGHAHREVVQAVNQGIRCGASFGVTTKPEIEIARFIAKHVPSVDKVRFVNSGTEATMSAIRLARGFTKREKIVKFDGCYHGHVDDLLTCAGSGVSGLHESSSEGIPKGHIQNTISLPYNDTPAFVQTIERHHKELACVIIEPVAGNMGVIIPDISFLETLRSLTKKHGIILIFDEVMTGFRGGLGCAQSDLGVIPDLTCLGKIIGGGFPVGAYGGRKDIMDRLSPTGGVYQAGTFAGNPVVMRAGLATFKNLTPGLYRRLDRSAENFVQSVNRQFAHKDIEAHVASYKSMFSLRFRKKAVRNYRDAQEASSSVIYPKLFHFLLSRRIYLPPADLEAFFISAEHSLKDLVHLADNLSTSSNFI